MRVWVSGIRNIDDARRIIRRENLRFPISVSCAYNCNEHTQAGIIVSIVGFEETIEKAIGLSRIREIAFLVSE